MTPARICAVLVTVATLVLGGGPPAAPAIAEPVGTTYLPLWPFASQDEADRWLREDAAAEQSRWHADAADTALRFARDFLGFAEMDRTTQITEEADEAWVGVGRTSPNGVPRTAATIHLARYGGAPDAPWEVVGTRDDVLKLSAPAYGSTMGTVIEAGGTITGVDESLHLQVRQSSHDTVLGDFCCVPAGGQERPWSATVSASPPRPGAVTLVVWSGGHVADVERFAVTGLRSR